MKRIPHGVYATLFGAAHLVLGTNVALAVWCLPFIALLVTTDPSLSWPLLALAAVPAGCGICAAFGVFRSHSGGDPSVLRAFLRQLRATWRPALALSAIVVAVVTVAAVDVFVLVPTGAGAVVAPLLVVIALLAVATGAVGLVAIAESPASRLRDVVRISLLLAVRRWPLTVLSLVVVGVQAAVVSAAPACGLGLTAAACLYIVWAGGRHTLQPALRPAGEAA
ncbi:hypothetical protein [Microbacterium indicum]|uniref:hypothetical protein n=1 Tax=Microbacterium indicum TaxID=358100 RepID=UPI000422090D|nr:hypothetical protein [Microbacterium indicum]